MSRCRVPAFGLGPIPGEPRSFCVALRSQPINTPGACKPLVNFRLALKAPDVPDFSSGIVGFDLPLALGDTVKFEGNPRFAHGPHYADLGRRRQRENDPFREQPTSCLSMAFGAPKAVDKAFGYDLRDIGWNSSD
jgi:hypothetical protein